MATAPATAQAQSAGIPLPRVTIQFCTQCKWMLRAAYYAQELLSTFSTALGEVALQPSTGGTFIVTITHATNTTTTTTTTPADPQDGSHHDAAEASAATTATGAATAAAAATSTASKLLWDRRIDGGFPETKELKRRVRDVVEPGRDLGHVDRHHSGVAAKAAAHDGGKTEQAADADPNPNPEPETKGGEGPDPKQDKKACEDCN